MDDVDDDFMRQQGMRQALENSPCELCCGPDDEQMPNEVKLSRRVREAAGGEAHASGIERR
jgi:hypothetical protein